MDGGGGGVVVVRSVEESGVREENGRGVRSR